MFLNTAGNHFPGEPWAACIRRVHMCVVRASWQSHTHTHTHTHIHTLKVAKRCYTFSPSTLCTDLFRQWQLEWHSVETTTLLKQQQISHIHKHHSSKHAGFFHQDLWIILREINKCFFLPMKKKVEHFLFICPWILGWEHNLPGRVTYHSEDWKRLPPHFY